MIHQMQLTSINAYWEDAYPKVHASHRKIIEVFTGNPGMDFTNTELTNEPLNIPINEMCPRVYELRGCDKRIRIDPPILVPAQIRKCRITGKSANAWQLNPALNRMLWRERRK